MAQAPSPATQSVDLPTIIIDPSLYEPEHPSQSHTVYDNLIRLTRVTLAVTAVGSATFGIARVLDVDSLLSSAQVSTLTSAFSDPANKNADGRSAPAAEHPPAAPQPIHDLLAHFGKTSARATAGFDETLTRGNADFEEVPYAASALPEERAPLEVAAAEPIATAPSPAAPPGATQTHSIVALAKSGNRTANVQDEIRNARRLLAMNRLEQAEAAYRGVLALNNDEAAALTGLARVQLALGQLDGALASATRAVDKAPDAASAHLTLGDVLRARGDRRTAQAHYDQAAQLKPAAATSTP